MKSISKWILTAALVILGALDLAKGIIADLVKSTGLPESTTGWVQLFGFLLTAYVAQQSKPITKRTRQKKQINV